QTQRRHFSDARLPAGQRHSARSGARQGGDQDAACSASCGLIVQRKCATGDRYRTSQRRVSSSTGALNVIQALAEKKQTAIVFSRCNVTMTVSRFSVLWPCAKVTALMSKPRP